MIDLIIATYNRPEIVCDLVEDIQKHHICHLSQIIIVDSSDLENTKLINNENVVYIHSLHKNQPYQRYLGYRLAKADYLLFLDDDMQLLDDLVFEKIEDVFQDKSIAGINLLFTNKNQFLEKQHGTNIKKVLPQRYVPFIRSLSGRPNIDDGNFWYCGLTGNRVDGKCSEFFSGGAFAARRDLLYINFNINLFTLFEKKIGMGEDRILAYTLSKQGKIYNLPGYYFFHNEPENSTYTASNEAYNKRVAYSRYYLSNEYARLNKKSYVSAYFITSWYNFWRITGLFAVYVRHKDIKIDGVRGYIKGTISGKTLYFNKDKTSFWEKEISNNLTNYVNQAR